MCTGTTWWCEQVGNVFNVLTVPCCHVDRFFLPTFGFSPAPRKRGRMKKKKEKNSQLFSEKKLNPNCRTLLFRTPADCTGADDLPLYKSSLRKTDKVDCTPIPCSRDCFAALF